MFQKKKKILSINEWWFNYNQTISTTKRYRRRKNNNYNINSQLKFSKRKTNLRHTHRFQWTIKKKLYIWLQTQFFDSILYLKIIFIFVPMQRVCYTLTRKFFSFFLSSFFRFIVAYFLFLTLFDYKQHNFGFFFWVRKRKK